MGFDIIEINLVINFLTVTNNHIQAMLTPVAISAGRHLADRVFGNQPSAKLDYSNIPTVVFSRPPVMLFF